MKETYVLKSCGILIARYPVFEKHVNEIWTQIYPAVDGKKRGWYKKIEEDEVFLDFDAGINFMVENGRLDYHGRHYRWTPIEKILRHDLEGIKEETEKAWRVIQEYESTLMAHEYLFFSESPVIVVDNVIVPCIHNGEKKWFTEGKILSLEDGHQWFRDNGFWESLY